MKVFPKVRVLDRIMEDIHKLRRDNRQADYVVVSEEEWCDLRDDRRMRDFLIYPLYAVSSAAAPSHASMTMTTRDFPRTAPAGRWGSEYRRVVSEGKFDGADIFVVPDEFMPR